MTRLVLLVLVGCLLTIPAPADARADLSGGVATPTERAAGRYCVNGRPSRFYRDAVGDGPVGVEATGIGVWNKRKQTCYWTTVTGRFNARRTQAIELHIDTNSQVRGYEYLALAYSSRDGDSRRGAFLYYYTSPKTAVAVRCRMISNFLVGRGEVRFGIPKSCLGSPAEIRLQAVVVDIRKYKANNRYRGVGDYVPNGGYTPFF